MSMFPVPVKLTATELMVCALCGMRRHIAAVIDGRPNAHGMSDEADGWGGHIEGACGEYGTAKTIGCCWVPTVNAFGEPDLLGWIEVKTCPLPNGRLIVRDGTPSHWAFVLVTGKAPSYLVRGYILGADARRDEWWTDANTGRDPAWFVPVTALRDIAELREMCRQ